LIDESTPGYSDASRALRLGLGTFAILALELAIIRWMSHQVRIFAYLNNVLLMASFLGMGLGVAIGRRRPRLIDLALPSLVVLAAVLTFSAQLHLLRIAFPDPTLSIWGAETLRGNETFITNLAKIVALFALVVWVFVCAGSVVGPLFASLRPLRAYTADLAGGLLNALPVAFAGVIFSTLLARSEDATSSLGSNLVGAMAGGCLEYASIVTGLRFLTAIAIALYGAAYVLVTRRGVGDR
jgi:hypothetical protein